MTLRKIAAKFIGYYRPYRLLFWTDMACALVLCAIDLAFPQILKFLTENVFVDGAANFNLRHIGLGLLAMYAVRTVCQYFITSWGHIMGARMESDMRQDLFAQYQRLSFTYYDKNNTGEMMSKLVNDLFDISELAHHGPENLFISGIKIIGSFAILTLMNTTMTLVLLGVTLAMVVFSLWQNKRMQRVFMDNRRKIADVNARVQDALSGIRVVKSFANEEVENDKFDVTNRRFLASKTDSYKVMGIFHAGTGFFEGVLYITVIVAGGHFIARGELSALELALYIIYIGIFLDPIRILIHFTEQFQKGYSGFRRFMEVIETQPEIDDAPDAKPLENVRGEICYEHVSFRYGDNENVLTDISLDIKPGQKIALVGPSGGGKTTLCSLLPRFYDVTAGAVKIDGHDIRTLTQDSLRNAIGIVQQDVYLFTGSIRDNIAYGKPGATDDEIVDAAKRAHIHDFIESLPEGYDTDTGERGIRLSGGQKQRIVIARVFLKNPRILILDEATSALDNESERLIQASLEALTRGRTTIVIAHRISTIRNADEILVLTPDGIRERGNHAVLMAQNGLYAKYYNMQFEGVEPMISDS